MAITRTAMIDDDGSGTTGTILNNAWKQELYNQIDAQAGVWTALTGVQVQNDGGTPLTATFRVNRYRQLGGNTVAWMCSVNPITVPAPTANLYLVGVPAFPFTIIGTADQYFPMAWAAVPAYVRLVNSVGVSALRADGANWAAGTQAFVFSILLEASGG